MELLLVKACLAELLGGLAHLVQGGEQPHDLLAAAAPAVDQRQGFKTQAGQPCAGYHDQKAAGFQLKWFPLGQ